MSSNQRNKRTCTEDTNCEKKSRRRDTYGKIAADQKEAMLLQRRTKKIELEKCNDSIKSVVECPSERMKSQRDTMLSKQSPLTIRESSSANVKGSTSGTCKGQQDVSPEVISNTVGSSHETPNLSTVFDKGKDVGHSFCGFERVLFVRRGNIYWSNCRVHWRKRGSAFLIHGKIIGRFWSQHNLSHGSCIYCRVYA
ncbi:uncharacterized protein LOC107796790 isoform X3 [Nicotiana tabacum]|uniref:Uncharacterized protein isoform X4 n=2 Tax=Nicotiana tabacum TaxID=4097 RepID=A0A1S4AEI0_TOBAC|nr:PREDICTED: uncharacterized protein LOC107796790 isoform X4 [Nicotiana tabacum]XP_016475096.1 PREDICTED: uncharacterized protein LOC107796790 isoform X4 [Nicotiana tabacum]